MNAKKRILLILIVFSILVLANPIRNFIRVRSYTDRDRTVTLPNLGKVSVHLADVKRVESDKVRVSMEVKYIERDTGDELVVPDMTITRPLAVRSPSFFHDGFSGYSLVYEGRCFLYTALFSIKGTDHSIDISQPLYSRRPDKAVYVELPISSKSGKKTFRQNGTARVQLIDFGRSEKYRSKDWYHVDGNTLNEAPSAGTFSVRIKQEDTDGPLMEYSAFPRNIWDDTDNSSKSCTAELIDDQGRATSMAESFVAKRDCEFLYNKEDHTQFIYRLLQDPESIVWMDVLHGPMSSTYIPGNGEWLYQFKPKPDHKYVKIRIKYQLPPKPQDRVTVRFDRVPI